MVSHPHPFLSQLGKHREKASWSRQELEEFSWRMPALLKILQLEIRSFVAFTTEVRLLYDYPVVKSTTQYALAYRTSPDFPAGSDSKAPAYNVAHLGLIPGLGRSPGEGNGNPLQYS